MRDRTCVVEGCERGVHSGGYCSAHLMRFKRYGDPLAGGASRDHRPLAERFMDQVQITEGCWVWTGPTVEGYGRVRAGGVTDYAHRVSWEIHVGPIPEGMHLDHVCHNLDLACTLTSECPHRRCVRPELPHMELVTPGENTRRSSTRRWANRG